ncbi:MAG: hypothetical protein LBJ21_02150, partial [Acidobacteriota bacterium]|nr:hypothetical protein [Acidobacteriota bacterium]
MKVSISKMFKRHIWSLILRSALLAAAIYLYFTDREKLDFSVILQQDLLSGLFLWIVWGMLIVEMLYRIFPNKRIAIGARKHFSCSYSAAQSEEENGSAIFTVQIDEESSDIIPTAQPNEESGGVTPSAQPNEESGDVISTAQVGEDGRNFIPTAKI